MCFYRASEVLETKSLTKGSSKGFTVFSGIILGFGLHGSGGLRV